MLRRTFSTATEHKIFGLIRYLELVIGDTHEINTNIQQRQDSIHHYLSNLSFNMSANNDDIAQIKKSMRRISARLDILEKSVDANS